MEKVRAIIEGGLPEEYRQGSPVAAASNQTAE